MFKRIEHKGVTYYMAVVENAKHAAERAAVSAVVDQLLKKINKAENYDERTKTYLSIVDWAEKFYTDAKPETFQKVREYVSDPNHR